jgi:hypothetical protein
MNPIEPNTPPQIRRVRRVGSEWHVTRTDGSTLAVPNVNTAPYRSRVSYGFGPDGALDSRPVKP